VLGGQRLRSWAVTAAILLSRTGAHADPALPLCDGTPEACGRQAFDAGVAAYKTGDFATATSRFTEALGYKWHPAIALNLALAQSQIGQYVGALQNLDAILQSPETSVPLHQQATEERVRVEGQLSVIEIDAGNGAAASLKVDGAAVDPRTPASVDPGTHHLELTLSSGASIQRDVSLAPRERLRLSIDRTHEFVLIPENGRRAAPGPQHDSTRAAPGVRAGVDPFWFYLGVGATAVLGGVTIWSALDTEAAHDAYARALPTASQGEVDRRVSEGHSLEARTNVLIAATGIAAVGTATLGVFFVHWKPTSTSVVVANPWGVSFRERF
jgi:hypothetical protein